MACAVEWGCAVNAVQIRLARELAQRGEDLSLYDDGVLFGCGCSDFRHPVVVSLGVVAKLMRWQYKCMDGSWDEKLWNEELWVYRRRIQVAEPTPAELVRWYSGEVRAMLADERRAA